MPSPRKPMVLVILDGWGYREDPADNAIAGANTPNWDSIWAECPHTLINTSGAAVGLPDDQMGNSEVGHMNLGAGRVVYQDFTRIGLAIENREFDENPVLCKSVDDAVSAGKAVHIMGLLSPGGVHSHESHIHAMIELAAKRGAKHIYLHAFLDGRDTPPRSAGESLIAVDELFVKLGVGRTASVIGRYYAMDRDQRWDRVEKAYRLILTGVGEHLAMSSTEALELAYERDENDEFVSATSIVPVGGQPHSLEDGDALIFMNFRSDRAREITHAFVDSVFNGFQRGRKSDINFVCLTQYQSNIKAPLAFGPLSLEQGFGEVLSQRGLRQLRIAETEKYAHVTFFFNGGREEPFEGEDRILVPSPKVATYDLQPEMNAPELTDKLTAAISSGDYDAIICNYANPDMVGHSGIYEAAVKAVEAIDECLGKIRIAVTESGGELLITADHGNVEMMSDPASGQAHTAHTVNPVPLIYLGRNAKLKSDGALSDLAPTMLYLMGQDQPIEMTGQSLVELED